MNRIGELGSKIFNAQSRLGMENPRYHKPGLNADELKTSELFSDLPANSELHDLFAWRDGASQEHVPMGKLWIRPGFYLVSSRECVLSNHYCAEHLSDWKTSWYPLLTDGSADSRFCDLTHVSNGRLPIYYYEPEEEPVTGQIYDSIELMFASMLECYEQGIYTITSGGQLRSDSPREADISSKLNPNSDYWLRNDLF